jgi:uncharacterized membrane protein YkvA (DUF1232 family)
MHAWLVAIVVALAIYSVLVLALIVGGRHVAGGSRSPSASLAICVVWLISPIDLLRELVPVLGPLDDAVVAALVLRCVIEPTGIDVVGRTRVATRLRSAILRAARIR